MDRRKRRLFAVGWLFLLHGLANVATALYRCHDIWPVVTDTLAIALPFSQLCLLVIWLVLGSKDPISWRILALVTGVLVIGSTYSRLVFPGFESIEGIVRWTGIDWWYYFRPSGPGDFLVQAPLLAGSLGLLLVAWRVGHRMVHNRERRWNFDWRPRWPWQWRLQFRFQDLLIWTLAGGLLLGSYLGTEPYDGWYYQLGERWLGGVRSLISGDYRLLSVPLHALVAVASLWAIRGGLRPARILAFVCLMLLLASVLDVFGILADPGQLAMRILAPGSPQDYFQPDSFRVPPPVWLSLFLFGGLLLASLRLVALYDAPIRELSRPPGRGLPAEVPLDASSTVFDAEANRGF